MYELPPLPPGVRTLSNVELARLRQRFPNMPSSPAQCPTCHGKKTFRWWHIEGASREIVDYKCPCVDQWMLHLFLLNSNIGIHYQRLSWFDVDSAEAGALDKVFNYLDHSDAYVQAGHGLILHGNSGTGKTLLSTLVLKTLLGQGHDGYTTTFSEMLDAYTGGWKDNDEKDWFHRKVKNSGILLIDDLGREYQGRQQSDLPRSAFDEVFRHRLAAATPTLITTNFDLTSVHDTYGQQLMSLIRERSTTYNFTGEDYRMNSTRSEEEIQQGLTRPVTIA